MGIFEVVGEMMGRSMAKHKDATLSHAHHILQGEATSTDCDVCVYPDRYKSVYDDIDSYHECSHCGEIHRSKESQ